MTDDWRLRLRALPFFGALRLFYHLIKSFETRRSALLMLRRPPGLFQPYGNTREDRYPKIFSHIRAMVADRRENHILSFGCSTGEEVFTLAHYFNQAHIKGIDIDATRIKVAQRRAADLNLGDRISFINTASTKNEQSSSYDAVFAMAVFRHGALQNAPEACSPWLHFDDFERAVTDLARVIKPGGYLALSYSNFRFTDTAASADFELAFASPPDPATPIYGRDDRRHPALADGGIYRKLPFR
ncbi:class I SAM-dependent methyltransferase [Lacibacterium aquatile]|uniref:Class I SAM-dependent methyltransferase n=1 Tax=Lacibacterium aquatile TaxID=1168082 RepID=A0ABW5DUA8_9PROT